MIALQGVLNNIRPNGTEAPGAYPGIIVASTSTENPNYFYMWTRDSALTMKMLIDEFLHGNTGLRIYIEDYLKAQAIIQTVSQRFQHCTSHKKLRRNCWSFHLQAVLVLVQGSQPTLALVVKAKS
ncbi:uncharacterized protein BDR25DRAFT_316495 [Lindgomyces ingoldianus]|uniref:Uncharacterized protein n=1 Tax=Lindgomyces ingoldianus TaxID=673940 RepID=A0ACB6QMX0_9PLEO|nr:uncharacterized protein BDR25DRAFT_316495 [Lindgomyces ingoldianus]KAF2467875.1 hypothetical protein BDR25DRAFT_316495 [Lindgomyces ingoldianus]